MKKLILFTILLFISEILFAQSFSGGTGTENDPFIIANAQDLMDLSNLSTGKGYLNKCYKLENDIQLTQSITPIGYNKSHEFSGTFDGNGKTIYDLVINKTKTKDSNIGLFGFVSGGTIKNLTLCNAKITVPNDNSENRHGILVGYLTNKAKVDNCNIINSNITSTQTMVGGIVGKVSDANVSIINCCVANSKIETKDKVGGICGYLGSMPTIENNVVYNTEIIATDVQPYIGNICGGTPEEQTVIDEKNQYYANTLNGVVSSNISKVVIPLVVGKWNFVGNNTNETVLSVSVFENNGASFAQDATSHAVAAKGYNYQTNDWNSTYLKEINNDVINQGEGIFVWVWNKDWDGSTIENDNIVYWSPSENPNTSAIYEIDKTNNGAEYNGALWFAFSNPFSEDVAVSTLLNGLTNIQGETQAYTFDGVKWNSNPTVIHSGEGFMVAASEGATTISGMLNKVAAKSEKNSDKYITITCAGSNSLFDVYSKIDESASNGFDVKDAYMMFSNGEDFVQPYFDIQGKNIVRNVFQTLPYAANLNIKATKQDSVILSAYNLPDNMTVVLKDEENETITILNDTTTKFEVEEGENANRFKVMFYENTSTNETIEENNIDILFFENTLSVQGNGLKSLVIYDLFGKQRYSKTLSGNSFETDLNLPQGLYIVKIVDCKGEKTSKVVIK